MPRLSKKSARPPAAFCGVKPMRVRPASPDDADALERVVRAAYAPFEHLGLPPVADGLAEDIRDHLVLVAEDSRLIGGIVAKRRDGAMGIANLAVDPKASGRGIGRLLLEEVGRIAMAEGHQHLTLTSHAGMTGTLAFYARLGWQETGREGNRVYLLKELDEGNRA